MRSLWIYIFLLGGIFSLYAETRNLGDGRTETINGNSYTFRWQQNFNNGGSVNVTMTGKLKDGKKDGVWKIFGTWNKCPVNQHEFYTGTASMTRSYNNGVPNGAYSLNYGLKHMTGRYVPTLGTWTYSSPQNMTVTASGNFKNGKPDGIWKMSNARTGKNYTMTFHNGRPHGSFDNGHYVYDDGLLLIRKYNGVGGYALIDEVKQSFDRNANLEKHAFPLIDQGPETAPYFYMKGGEFVDWLGRFGGKSTEEPVIETFEPGGAYIEFTNIKQLDDPQYVRKATADMKSYWQKEQSIKQASEFRKELETQIQPIAQALRHSELPEDRFIVYLFEDVPQGVYSLDSHDVFTLLAFQDPKFDDIKRKYLIENPDDPLSKVVREFERARLYEYGFSYDECKDIINGIIEKAKNEAKFFYYDGDDDSLLNFIYDNYRPHVSESMIVGDRETFPEVIETVNDGWKNLPNSTPLDKKRRFLCRVGPVNYSNTDEWYTFLYQCFEDGLRKNMKLTAEDIKGYVIDKYVSEKGNKFKVEVPKIITDTPTDIKEFVFLHRLGMSPEVALTDDYKKYYYAKWAERRRDQAYSMYNISKSLAKDKKFNKIVEELASICIY